MIRSSRTVDSNDQVKTQQSPRASPGKVPTPKKLAKVGMADAGKVSPAKSAKSERSERSQPKSERSNRKDSQPEQLSWEAGPDKQISELPIKHIEMKQLK